MTKRHPVHATLKAHPLFAEFTDDEIAQLLESAEPTLFSADETIVRKGEKDRSMFLVAEGTARVTVKAMDGNALELAQIEAGEFIGELALVDSEPRSADVIATTDCMVLEFTMPVLKMLADQSPIAAFKLAMAVLELVSRRLRKANTRYLDSLGILSAISGELSLMVEPAE